MSEEWTWQLRTPAKRTYDDLDDHARNRITDKLDEIVNDRWRDPDDYLEPLAGVPHQKLRVGPFRVGCRLSRDEKVLWVLTIKKRGGDAYRSDD